MKWLHRKSLLFNVCLGFLWFLLTRLAFHFLPTLPAILVSIVVFALLQVPLPTKQEQQEEIRQEIEESKKSWRQLNK